MIRKYKNIPYKEVKLVGNRKAFKSATPFGNLLPNLRIYYRPFAEDLSEKQLKMIWKIKLFYRDTNGTRQFTYEYRAESINDEPYFEEVFNKLIKEYTFYTSIGSQKELIEKLSLTNEYQVKVATSYYSNIIKGMDNVFRGQYNTYVKQYSNFIEHSLG